VEKSSVFALNSTIKDLSRLIYAKEISPVDLIESTLERIQSLNSKLNAFITVMEDSAREDAKNAESMIEEGKYKGPLHGIPISLKDLIYVNGVKSTSGSKIMSDFIPNYDSTVVKKLKDAGAIIVGTNNTHEFACGVTNINPHYGSSKNPWDPIRMSGGSSGGSAVAVSAGMASASIGTDTSGSIRIPSSLCGLFGLKPTYGRVSKYGVMKLAPSIDHVGPITRSAWDAAALLQAIAGYDEQDISTNNIPVHDYIQFVSEKMTREFKVGIPKQYFFDVIDPKVLRVFEQFVDKLHGCKISTSNINLDKTDKIFESWRAIRLGESAAVHKEWLRSRPYDYGSDVRTMLQMGLEITAVEYINAHKWRQEIKNAFLKAMADYDALLVPTTILSAPLLDQKMVSIDGNNFEVYSALSRLTTVSAITGLPALNVPAGLVDNKLPIGAQLIGRPFDEGLLLRIAYYYEEYYNIPQYMVPPITL
jgi:aspartyl-tRNA(Asn)/glutamyl-tRNA(Gln) amidotransferase subunit A